MTTHTGDVAETARRKYNVVDDDARTAAIDTVVAAIAAGTSFTAACRAVAISLDVADTTVRGWVNNSGQRPRGDIAEIHELRRALAVAADLNHRLSRSARAGTSLA